MRPILFSPTSTSFTSHGLGALFDAISCEVEEERNGSFELTLKYPMEGERFHDIKLRSIILAKPNPTDSPQPFRVYEINANMDGTVTVNAAHISYDMSGIPVQPFSAQSLAAALTTIKANAVVPCPFTLLTDKTVASPMNHAVPSSMRSLLGGTDGSLLDLYGGEWKYDVYDATLMLHRGTDNGVVIKYGKNLTDLEQEKNCAESWTGVYPYWVSQDGETIVQLPERIIRAVTNDGAILQTQSGNNITTNADVDIILEDAPVDTDRILMLNLSQSEDTREQVLESAPTVAELRAKAQAYIERNDIFSPKVSLKVSFEQLADTEEYADIALLEQVNLCDTVTVVFPQLGVSSQAKVVKTTYDVLLDRYESVEIGSSRTNIADTIASMQTDITSAEDSAYSSINAAGGTITGDLTVGGTTQLDGTFKSNSRRVFIKHPDVWLTALGLFQSANVEELENGLSIETDYTSFGYVVSVFGTPTTASITSAVQMIVTKEMTGLLLDSTGNTRGYFTIGTDGGVTISATSTSTYVFGQVFIPEVGA